LPTVRPSLRTRPLPSPDFLDGRPLVLQFFAGWAVTAQNNLPIVQAVYEDVSDQVNFLGVTVRSDRRGESSAEEVVESTGVEFPWGHDSSGTGNPTNTGVDLICAFGHCDSGGGVPFVY
jgi:hypothetical protein